MKRCQVRIRVNKNERDVIVNKEVLEWMKRAKSMAEIIYIKECG